MEQKIVTITIDAEGNTHVETTGFQGQGCGALHEAYSKAFGKATEVVNKPEYHAPVKQKNQLNQSR